MKSCYAVAALLAANANASATFDATWGVAAPAAFDATLMQNKQTDEGPTVTTTIDPVESFKSSFQFSWSSK